MSTSIYMEARNECFFRQEWVSESELAAALGPTAEVGRIDGFTIHLSPPSAFDVNAGKPKQITHGPQRKGRGGKVKRW